MKERRTGFEPATLTLARWWFSFLWVLPVRMAAVKSTQVPGRPPNPSA